MATSRKGRRNSDKARHWQQHIQGWSESGLSQAEYCRLRGLSAKSFGYWMRSLREPKDPGPALIPVSLGSIGATGGRPVDGSPLVVIAGERYRVEIRAGFDMTTLRELLFVLAQA